LSRSDFTENAESVKYKEMQMRRCERDTTKANYNFERERSDFTLRSHHIISAQIHETATQIHVTQQIAAAADVQFVV